MSRVLTVTVGSRVRISPVDFVLFIVLCSKPLSVKRQLIRTRVPDSVAGVSQTHQLLHFLQFDALSGYVSVHICLGCFFNLPFKVNLKKKQKKKHDWIFSTQKKKKKRKRKKCPDVNLPIAPVTTIITVRRLITTLRLISVAASADR